MCGLVIGMGSAWAGEEMSEEQALEAARKVKDEIVEKLKIPLATEESPNFILHTDTPSLDRKNTLKAGETAYKRLDAMFQLPKDTKPWKGKYVVLLFKDRQEFADYWYKVKEKRGELAGSIPLAFGPGTSGYAANAKPGRASDQTGNFYFFLPALFLSKYMEGKKVPPWVDMGFRRYCGNVMAKDKDGTNRARQEVREALQKGDRRSFQVIRETPNWPPSDGQGRELCFSLVDYMISLGQKKFVGFIDRLKADATETQAIMDAFGVTTEDFEKGWMAYIRSKY